MRFFVALLIVIFLGQAIVAVSFEIFAGLRSIKGNLYGLFLTIFLLVLAFSFVGTNFNLTDTCAEPFSPLEKFSGRNIFAAALLSMATLIIFVMGPFLFGTLSIIGAVQLGRGVESFSYDQTQFWSGFGQYVIGIAGFWLISPLYSGLLVGPTTAAIRCFH
jgi:hypothetical protein